MVAMGSARRYSALSALLRKPKAHVTLARPKRRATERERAAGLVWASELDVRAVRVRLDRVALYTWDEARDERLFRIVAERRLG